MALHKKTGVLFAVLLTLAFSAAFASASLEIKKEIVSSVAIPELNLPAIFNLEIANNGAADTFTIYCLANMRIEPNNTIYLNHGDTQTLVLKAYPTIPAPTSPYYYSFAYKYGGEITGIQEDTLAVNIVELKDAFNFQVDDINPDSKTTMVHFENKAGHSFEKVKVEISSEFLSETFEFPLNAYENKKIEVNLDEAKVKELLAGPYVINAEITVGKIVGSTSAVMNFNERPSIQTTETKSGWIVRIHEIEKKNSGNTKADVSIVISKNLLSALFTGFNIGSYKKELSGFSINYYFRKELSPDESLKVTASTSWWMLAAAIIILYAIYYLIDKYIRNKIVLKKTVSFVRTKGGEFALRVNIVVKARDFVERIRILDRLPPMVKIFEKYGTSMPDKIDERNRRLEWNIQALSAGEERVLSFIVYSKIGVMGRFELPASEAIYEYKGKIKEAYSNSAAYINEPMKGAE